MIFGPHSAFIIASYAVMLAGVAGLIAWVVLDGQRMRRRIAELEARGVRRRSADPS